MQTVQLNARLRVATGKGAARRLRREGFVPGVFYGPKVAATPIAFGLKEFRDGMSGHEGAALVELRSEAQDINGRVALVKDLQHDALTGRVLHADLYEVDMRQTVRVPMPLHFVGKPKGVVRGGVLQPIVREVEVECLPGDIPEFLEVDVSGLDLQESLHISELTLPDGVVATFEEDIALVMVAPPSTEEAPTEAEAEEAEPAVAADAAEKPAED